MKKLLKKIGFGILGLFILLLVIGFLLPSERTVSVTEEINAPISLVFDQVNDLRNWEKWSPWKELDPLMEMSYSNPPAGKGAFYKWKSNHPQVGSGKMTLSEVVPNQKIVTVMDFEDWDSGSAEFTFKEENRKTEVTWSMDLHLGRNPVSKYMGLFIVGGLRGMFDRGLESMKINVENR
jgi:uncharacterized protein YndB with AHSA1/START domain